MTQGGRVHVGEEVRVLGQHVGRDRQGGAAGIDQRAIVPDALALVDRAGEIARDQLELVHRPSFRGPEFRGALTRPARLRRADPAGDLVKHAVHVPETLGRSETLGELHRFARWL